MTGYHPVWLDFKSESCFIKICNCFTYSAASYRVSIGTHAAMQRERFLEWSRNWKGRLPKAKFKDIPLTTDLCTPFLLLFD